MRIVWLTWIVLALTIPGTAFAQMPSGSQINAGPTSIPDIRVEQDWQVLCSPNLCQAEPRRGGTSDLSLTILPDDGPDSDQQVMILRAPLGLLLGQGVAVTVDGRSLGRLAFLTCEVDGCVAPVRLDGSLARALRGGTTLTLTLMRRDETPITADYSLLGFTAAMTILRDTPVAP